MMLLAATLASLGLLEGSTAVVIGAMLVAPLMGPARWPVLPSLLRCCRPA
jgi:uncharacterized membrane protein